MHVLTRSHTDYSQASNYDPTGYPASFLNMQCPAVKLAMKNMQSS